MARSTSLNVYQQLGEVQLNNQEVFEQQHICPVIYESVHCMQATIDMEMEAKHMELKKEKELLGRRHMDRDNALRKVRKANQALDSAQDQLPPLKTLLHASKLDITALKKVQGKTAASAVELKKDTDILINSFLKEEKKVGVTRTSVL